MRKNTSGFSLKLAQSTLSDDLWKADHGLGYDKTKFLIFQQLLQANQFQQQQMMKQRQQGGLGWGQQQIVHKNRARNGSNGRPLGFSPSAWPTLQQSQQQQPTPQ